MKELKIQKTTTTPTIEAGGIANFSIKVTNHKGQDATNVIVSDIVPQGLTVISASTSGVVNGNTITWDLGTMTQAQVMTLTYSAQADMNGSLRLYRDELEDEPNGLDWYEENSTQEDKSDNFSQQLALRSFQILTTSSGWTQTWGHAVRKTGAFESAQEGNVQ